MGGGIFSHAEFIKPIIRDRSEIKSNIGWSMSSGHRLIGAKLERMVITKDLLMELVSIVLQHPLNRLCPVAKDEFQFRAVDF
jgi:hypothetical protein